MRDAAEASIREAPQEAPGDRAVERFLLVTAGVVSFALLTWAGARSSVPLPSTPVPGSLQTLAVLLSGAILGARRGAASQSLYLAMGLAGLPVFAHPGAGPAYFLGPTGGYLLGFVAGSYVTGASLPRLRGFGVAGSLLSFSLGTAAVYASGIAWLIVLLGGDALQALRLGLAPFALFDLAKIVIASGLLTGWARVSGMVKGAWRTGTER